MSEYIDPSEQEFPGDTDSRQPRVVAETLGYKITFNDKDPTLKRDPEIGSIELAIALCHHFPLHRDLESQRAAMKLFWKEHRRQRKAYESSRAPQPTNQSLFRLNIPFKEYIPFSWRVESTEGYLLRQPGAFRELVRFQQLQASEMDVSVRSLSQKRTSNILKEALVRNAGNTHSQSSTSFKRGSSLNLARSQAGEGHDRLRGLELPGDETNLEINKLLPGPQHPSPPTRNRGTDCCATIFPAKGVRLNPTAPIFTPATAMLHNIPNEPSSAIAARNMLCQRESLLRDTSVLFGNVFAIEESKPFEWQLPICSGRLAVKKIQPRACTFIASSDCWRHSGRSSIDTSTLASSNSIIQIPP